MRFFARLRHVRLTTAIAALMLVSIAVTIAAYSVSTYLSLRGQALDQAVAQQSADLKTAATIYERRLNGSVLTWSEEDGSIVSFTTYSIPFFYDTAAVDSVEGLDQLSAAATDARVVIDVLVDLNVGQNRCGVAPGEEAVALGKRAAGSALCWRPSTSPTASAGPAGGGWIRSRAPANTPSA